MSVHIVLCGAAGEVTGSGYLVQAPRATVLVDFGMFQGAGATFAKNRSLGRVDPSALNAVVLTHAHLDHAGRIPLLVRAGYSGPIYATPATIDFTRIILADSARIQEGDTQRRNRRRERAGLPPLEPLYTAADAEAVSPLLRELPYSQPREIAQGVRVRLEDAGHILGSAGVEMIVEDGARSRTIVFSGDVGQRGMPYLRDPTLFGAADLAFLESTYGDRDHRSLKETVSEFQDALRESVWQNEKVLIPAFAIGRTQLILYHVAELMREGRTPEFPIYLDSPMAIEAMKVYRKHEDLFDEQATELVKRRQLRADLRRLQLVETVAESRRLNECWEGCVIIAGSGMCDGGRIVHHLKHNLWRRNVTLLAVGYMAKGSLGRRLVDGETMVKILGRRIAVRATVRTLGGFSAHAGRSELLDWARPPAESGARFVLTHGEDPQRASLAHALRREHDKISVECPGPGAVIEL